MGELTIDDKESCPQSSNYGSIKSSSTMMC